MQTSVATRFRRCVGAGSPRPDGAESGGDWGGEPRPYRDSAIPVQGSIRGQTEAR